MVKPESALGSLAPESLLLTIMLYYFQPQEGENQAKKAVMVFKYAHKFFDISPFNR